MAECEKDLYDQTLVATGAYARLKEKYQNNACFLAAYCEEQFAGYAAFYCNDEITKTAYLSMIVVKREYRNRGVGMALMEHMREICRSNGFSKISLEVDSGNFKAKNLYQKCGYLLEGSASNHTVYLYLNL